MSRPRNPFPTLRRHSSGVACATFTDAVDGRRAEVHFGPYGTPESRRNFDDEVARWIARGRRLPLADERSESSVNEVCLAFLEHTGKIWVGERKRHHETLKRVVGLIRPLCGTDPISTFGPKKLKQVRQRMIDHMGWCRSNVNKNVNLIRQMFRWASEEELIDSSVWHGLLAVKSIRVNTPGVREGRTVRPVDPAAFEATVPFLPPLMRVVARLQRLTGARGGELLTMRPCDIDRSNPKLWRYAPASHKTQRHGHRRVIRLGERCVELLEPVLEGVGESDYVFSPQRSEEIRSAERAKKRKTKLYPSHAARNEAIRAKSGRRRRPPKRRYYKEGYCKAVARACKRAGVEHWFPHQVRHLVGTELRKKFDLDTARAMLGHRSVSMTAEYAQLDDNIADAVARDCC